MSTFTGSRGSCKVKGMKNSNNYRKKKRKNTKYVNKSKEDQEPKIKTLPLSKTYILPCKDKWLEEAEKISAMCFRILKDSCFCSRGLEVSDGIIISSKTS